jgi:hypothetical protein
MEGNSLQLEITKLPNEKLIELAEAFPIHLAAENVFPSLLTSIKMFSFRVFVFLLIFRLLRLPPSAETFEREQ